MSVFLEYRIQQTLSCPNCAGKLYQDEDNKALVCRNCKTRYEIRNGIPMLLGENLDYISKQTKKYYNKLPMDTGVEGFGEAYYKNHPIYREIIEDIRLRKSDPVIIDIGCGSGHLVSYLQSLGFTVAGLDQSITALCVSRNIYDSRNLINGTNMKLPFQDAQADIVISNGVIFLTPDPYKSLLELLRVLKHGGKLHLALYNRNHVYYWIYKYVGGMFRFLDVKLHFGWILKSLFLPPFYLIFYIAQLIIFGSVKPVSARKCWNVFGDTFLTPHCKFYTAEEGQAWLKKNNMYIEKISYVFTGTMIYYKTLKDKCKPKNI